MQLGQALRKPATLLASWTCCDCELPTAWGGLQLPLLHSCSNGFHSAVAASAVQQQQEQQQLRQEQQQHPQGPQLRQSTMKEFSDYETGAPAGQKHSDSESVRTEDFVNKFNQMLVPDNGGAGHSRGGAGAASRSADADSVKTEDFAREFRKALVQPQTRDFSAAKARAAYRPLSSFRDSESVKTEDLENKFRSLMVRGPPPPVAAYDDSYLSSSDSNLRAQLLKDRVGSLMRGSGGCPRLLPSDLLSDSETERTERRLQELREARTQRESFPPKVGLAAAAAPVPSAPRVTSLTAGRRSTSPTRVSDSRARVKTRISPIREVAVARSFPREEPPEDEEFLLEDDEFANEVRYQSRLIQREMEQERRKRLARDRSESPLRQPATPRESLDRKVLELDELNYQVRKTLQEKEKILAELHFVQDCLRKHQAEVRLSEKLCRDNKSKAEDTKTELMLAEVKRDSTAKELDGLTGELREKKDQLKRMEEVCKSRMKELQDLESIGIAREEIENILSERDELYQLIRQNEDAEYQRYELEKKLTQTREEMLAQASLAQQKVIALEEELEASLTKIAETTEDRNAFKVRLSDMDEKLRVLGTSLDDLTEANRRLVKAKETAEKERIEEVERLKQRMQADLAHIQRRTEEEELSFKRQIQQLKETLEGIQAELVRKDEINCALREQIAHLEGELGHEAETKTHLINETERHLQKTGAEAERRMDSLREELRRESDERLARERTAWQLEASKEAKAAQEKLQRNIAELEFQLSGKEDELRDLHGALASKEVETKSAEEDFKTELRERVRATVRSEKEKWEKESSERWRRELGSLKEETARTIESLQAESGKKSEAIAGLEGALDRLNADLDAEREKAKAVQREKVAAVGRARDSAKEDAAREARSVREQCETVAREELQRLQEQLGSAEAALAAARIELEDSARREAELAGVLEKVERAVVGQANGECAKIAQMLGVTPRRVSPGSYRPDPSCELQPTPQPHRSGSSSLSSPANPVTGALANLEACGEELRAYSNELREQAQKLKERLSHETKSREEEVSRLRELLSQEKSAELQALRERLIGEHMVDTARLAKAQTEALEAAVKEREAEVRELRANMKKWKSETAERLAVRLQEEFRREFDKKIRDLRNTVRSRDHELQSYRKEAETAEREVTRAPAFRTMPELSGGASDPSSKVILQLQDRVRSLREENLGLRRTIFAKPGATADSASTAAAAASAAPPEPLRSRGQPTLAASPAAAHLSGSFTSLPRAAAESSDNYVQHLETKLRALEERVRRAERHSEHLNTKDRVNSLARQQHLVASASGERTPAAASPSAQSSARPGGSQAGSFRASSSNHGGSGR